MRYLSLYFNKLDLLCILFALAVVLHKMFIHVTESIKMHFKSRFKDDTDKKKDICKKIYLTLTKELLYLSVIIRIMLSRSS